MIVVSLGGNALIRRNERGSIEEQFRNASAMAEAIAGLFRESEPLVITHGNGPTVGNIVIQNERASDAVPPMPLYVSDADSEGAIGFIIQLSLHNALVRAKKRVDVVTLVTQSVVRPDDPAFLNPTKPIGPFYTKEEASGLSRSRGWAIKEVAPGEFRRVVPSPRPVRIVEAGVIKRLSLSGTIVIAAGGGGVPVVESADGILTGVDAVIDKDRATSVLARAVGAKLLVTLTDVDAAYLDFNSSRRKRIARMTVAEAQKFLAEGEFPEGSMGPKVEAAVDFVRATKGEAVITSPELLREALNGLAGTRITA
jgi:carbamate kinase